MADENNECTDFFSLLDFQPKSEKTTRWGWGEENRRFRWNSYLKATFFLINTNVLIIYGYLLQFINSYRFRIARDLSK